jgi:hypothetical protein
MLYARGTEDFCWPVLEERTRLPFGKEVTIVAVYPDCKLYMGCTPTGNIQGWAKVVDGKTVWVKCYDSVPAFKERFYEKF